jgi:hypothetical protein
MIVKLDKARPNYKRKLAQLRRIAADLGGEPKGLFYFKTFDEFNDYKDIFKKSIAPSGKIDEKRP